MGRRNDHSREDLRTLSLEAAQKIMATQGLKGLTARRLAAEIGYTPGTLYNLFENLDELILRVNAENLERLGVKVRTARQGEDDKGGDVAAKLKAMARAYIEETRAEPLIWDAILEHRMSDGESAPEWYSEGIARLFDLIEEVLQPLFPQAAGQRRHRAARVLWSGVHGVTALALSQKLERLTGLTAEAMVDDLIDTYLAGLAVEAAPAATDAKSP